MKVEQSAPTRNASENEVQQPFTWRAFRDIFSDWQFYPMAFVFWSNTVTGYGLKFTMPQIIKNMGFSSSNAQLMYAAPAYIYMCVCVL